MWKMISSLRMTGLFQVFPVAVKYNTNRDQKISLLYIIRLRVRKMYVIKTVFYI